MQGALSKDRAAWATPKAPPCFLAIVREESVPPRVPACQNCAVPAARRRPWLRLRVGGDVRSGLAAVAVLMSDALAAGGRGGKQDSDPLRAADAPVPARLYGTRKTRAASNVSPAGRTGRTVSPGDAVCASRQAPASSTWISIRSRAGSTIQHSGTP